LAQVQQAAAVKIRPGDIVITQESPSVRRAERSKTAGADIFLLRPSGIETIARPPAITGPRGIRADADGSFIFADFAGPAIRRLHRDGSITTVAEGAPLQAPKDVNADMW
jgi:streptogramin lyase